MPAGEIARLYVKIIGDISEFKSSMQAVSKSIENVGKSIQAGAEKVEAFGSSLTRNVTLPLAAAGVAAFTTFDQLDDAFDTVIAKTGATGDAAKKLESAFYRVAKTSYASLQEIGAAIGEVVVRFRLSGKELETATKKFIAFAKINRIDVSTAVRLVSRMMKDWGVKTKDYARQLDMLMKASQLTGVSLEQLGEKIVFYGVQLRMLGFAQEEAIAVLSKWEAEGVATEKILGVISMALGKLAKKTKEPVKEFWRLTDAVKKAKTNQEALVIASQVLGARGAADFVAAVREGRLAIEGYVTALRNSRGALDSTEKEIIGLKEQFLELKNRLIVELQPALSAFITNLIKLIPVIERVINAVAELTKAFAALPAESQEAIFKFIGIVAIAGPLLNFFSKMISAVGAVIASFGKLASVISGLKLASVIAAIRGVVTAIFSIKAAIAVIIAVVFAATAVFIYHFTRLKLLGVSTAQAIRVAFENIPLVGAAFKKIAPVAINAFSSIEKAFISMINSIISAANKFVRAWNRSFLGRVFKLKPIQLLKTSTARKGGAPIGGPTALQTGGIVTRPTLSLIGEKGPEAVIPLSKLKELVGTEKVVVEIKAAPGLERLIDFRIKQYKEREARR
jgi:phage-related minor tail protein